MNDVTDWNHVDLKNMDLGSVCMDLCSGKFIYISQNGNMRTSEEEEWKNEDSQF